MREIVEDDLLRAEEDTDQNGVSTSGDLPGNTLDQGFTTESKHAPDQLAAARRRAGADIFLEASGNVDEAGLQTIAVTGVDAISVGAITKHVRAIDLSMRFDQL